MYFCLEHLAGILGPFLRVHSTSFLEKAFFYLFIKDKINSWAKWNDPCDEANRPIHWHMIERNIYKILLWNLESKIFFLLSNLLLPVVM